MQQLRYSNTETIFAPNKHQQDKNNLKNDNQLLVEHNEMEIKRTLNYTLKLY